MNWSYISGFFDADGSITLTKVNKKNNKTIQISFHNCEVDILKEIQRFIIKNLSIKGHISLKKGKKDNHSDAYDLKYTYRNGYEVMKRLVSIHSKKVHRMNIYHKIQECTPRNGKYTEELLAKRRMLEKQFFEG